MRLLKMSGGYQEMAEEAAKDCALCLTGELVRMVKKVPAKVPEEGVDLDDEEPEAEDGEEPEDPDGIC